MENVILLIPIFITHTNMLCANTGYLKSAAYDM